MRRGVGGTGCGTVFTANKNGGHWSKSILRRFSGAKGNGAIAILRK